ncbi:PIR protein [Plasmodium yoelii]|nr:PIR protein [Plasmodium yoelii]VTZ74016.1 PIR protein [Plasmodium yoelii]|eukprot:XP_022812312.2 PIR protein [Plasmodium yoelii]
MGQNQMNNTKFLIKESYNTCDTFDSLRALFPDELYSGKYNFKGGKYKSYYSKSNYTDIDKINGYCLWLFKQFYGDRSVFSNNVDNNMYIVTYIWAWLSYKLNQKSHEGINNLNDFYNKHMENVQEYNNSIENDTEYKTYIDLINKNKELMDIDIKHMSKFYDAFKNLCKMYDDLSKAKNKGEEYLKYVNNFAENYNALINENINDTKDNLFKQVLYVALNDYNFIKSILSEDSIKKQFPELTKEKKATQVSTIFKESQIRESSGDVPESSSKGEVSESETDVLIYNSGVSEFETAISTPLIANKLIIVLSTLFVIAFFLGISYKYSLFGFRKKSQKQHLREKLKK